MNIVQIKGCCILIHIYQDHVKHKAPDLFAVRLPNIGNDWKITLS